MVEGAGLPADGNPLNGRTFAQVFEEVQGKLFTTLSTVDSLKVVKESPKDE